MDLNILWFVLIGALFTGYFVLDGFDFGVGISLPFVGRSDTDRRVLINTIGPIWDLNETWVIVAGACMFAAFPEWYASVFSGFYLALLLMLLALIARGVSFEYRHLGKGVEWTRWFDWMIFAGSAVPALLWGVAFANIVQGIPMDADFNFTGTFFDLLNPYALLGGLTTLSLFWYHGLVFLGMKTEGVLRDRAQAYARVVGVVVAVLAIAFLGWTIAAHFSVLGLVLALVGVLAFVVSWVANLLRRDGWAFGFAVLTIVGAVGALFASLFPNLLPNTAGGPDMTIYNGSSSEYTLSIMQWAIFIIMPFVLAYQAWTFWTFRKRIRHTDIDPAHGGEATAADADASGEAGATVASSAGSASGGASTTS